jgi:transcriptional regulator with XRE-family HTH domain
MDLDAAEILREARRRSGLTQRQLADRASTSQSVIARIEAGHTRPGDQTLRHLLAAAGFDVVAHLVPRPVVDSHMLTDVDRLLRLSPEDRLRETGNVSRFLTGARRV